MDGGPFYSEWIPGVRYQIRYVAEAWIGAHSSWSTFGRYLLPCLPTSEVISLLGLWQVSDAVHRKKSANGVQGGLSSAGGSVTLGMVADLWEAEEQQWAVAFVVLSSVGGTTVGPIVGGPIAAFLSWRWNIWVQLIFGGVVQAVHFFMPESRSTILMDREARRRRKTGGDPNVYGPNEVKKPRVSLKEFSVTWIRPFEMVSKPLGMILILIHTLISYPTLSVRPRANCLVDVSAFGLLGRPHLHVSRRIPARVQAVGFQYP